MISTTHHPAHDENHNSRVREHGLVWEQLREWIDLVCIIRVFKG